MLNLETRQIQILSILLGQDYISLEQLIALGHFSQNTILSEIHDINDVFKNSDFHCQIINHRGKGYTLQYEPSQKQMIQKLKKHCHLYLSIPNHSTVSNYERVIYLLRYFIYQRQNIKSEGLAHRMSVSLATLNKDLRIVRNILSKYHITIESVPYYGMHLKGQELSIRSCFIDYCDVYIINEENIFPQYFMEQFDLTYEKFFQIYDDIRTILIQQNIGVDEFGIRRLALYILTLPILSYHSQDINEIEIDFQHPLKLLLHKYNLHLSLQEDTLLSIFFLSVLDISEMKDYEKNSNEFHNCIRKLYEISGLYIELDSSLYVFIKQAVNKVVHCYQNGIYCYAVPQFLKEKIRREISSYSFSQYIIHSILPKETMLSYDYLFYEIAIKLYAIVYNVRNEYYPCRALVVSGFGKNYAKVACERLKRSLTKVDYIPCYEYELEKIDFTHYDFVLAYDVNDINLKNIPVPVYEDKMNSINQSSIRIWSDHVAKKRKIKVLRPYLDYPVYSTILDSAQMIDIIIDAFMNKGYILPESRSSFKGLLYQLIYDGLYDQSSGIKIITLFTNQDIGFKYFAFSLKEPVYIDGGKIVLLHFLFMNTSNGPIVIKNGDSELHRYFNL